LLYLVRLADKSGVDLEKAVTAKLALNAQKYPIQQARGSAKKYTELGN
jgi:dCTP diphosphatase